MDKATETRYFPSKGSHQTKFVLLFFLTVPQKYPNVRKHASLTISYTGPGIHTLLVSCSHSIVATPLGNTYIFLEVPKPHGYMFLPGFYIMQETRKLSMDPRLCK